MPTYSSSGINGIPALNFNSSEGDHLDFDGSFLIGSDYTIFVVAQRNGVNAYNFFVSGSGSSNGSNLHFGYRDTNEVFITHFGAGQDLNSSSFPVADYPHIHTFSYDNSTTTASIRIDGVPNGSASITYALASYEGSAIGGSTGNYNGKLGELIIFNRTLSDEEVNSIEGYLSQKWKIALQ